MTERFILRCCIAVAAWWLFYLIVFDWTWPF